jgi:hypothetical protein
MIFAIGAEVLFRTRMPSACHIGCEYPTPAASHRQNGLILTSSRINFDLDQTESRARHLYLTRLKDQMSLLS